jgi:hypothetical protein
LVHISTAGSITYYALPTLDADLGGMILGANQHIWFAEYTGVIGEFTT